jgi:Sulfotransferase family
VTTPGPWERRLRAAVSDPRAAWDVVRRRYLSWAFLDRGGGPADAVLLAGSARSGTSWLAGLLNPDDSARYVFEPFRPGKLALTRGFGVRRYLRPADERPELLRAARAVLSGEVRSRWTDQFNRSVFPERRLVKDVWSNLMLGWLHRHVPEVPVVFLLRHPCAVVSSQVRLAAWGWEVDVAGLLAQHDLVRDHLSDAICDELSVSRTPFDRHLATWCVETLVPLRQFAPGDVFVAFYERLCTEPEAELRRLFRFLGRSFDGRVMDRLATPSAAARPDSADGTATFSPDAWVRRVDRDRLRTAMATVRRSGLGHLYGEDPMPLPGEPDAALLATAASA